MLGLNLVHSAWEMGVADVTYDNIQNMSKNFDFTQNMTENYDFSHNMTLEPTDITKNYDHNLTVDYSLDYSENSSNEYQSDYQELSYSGLSSSPSDSILYSDWTQHGGESLSSTEALIGHAKFNFSGLSVSSLTTTPREWDPRENFLELVAFKIYMFVPAIGCGVLLGLLLWTLTLIILRITSHIKKRLFMSLDIKSDIAMEEGGDKRINKKQWTETKGLESSSGEVSYRSGHQRAENVLGYMSEIMPPPSPHSSSTSSGIGESEKESPSERSSRRASEIQVLREKKDDRHLSLNS